MSIPFMGLFKKAKAKLGKQSPSQPAEAMAKAPLPEKSAAERLSKTVMPNATRTVAPADPFKPSAGGTIRLRESHTAGKGERTIAISLLDILDHFPLGVLKPREHYDADRYILLKAAEVEKGMATGQPSALLTSIYEQAPEIFMQGVTPGDQTQVALPFAKVMEQFQSLHVRADQMHDDAVPQVETPFLQVTIEDTQKFGTTLAPLQTSAKPPVKVEPATARSIATAEPEPVIQKKVTPDVSRRPISLAPPATIPGPPPAAEPAAGKGPTRIPFKLPPNGAGAPASERVPASSGPPVPTPPPAPPKAAAPAAPARIPFKMTPPSPELKPKLTLVPGDSAKPEAPAKSEAPAPAAESAESAKQDGVTIKLRLNVCLRNLPAFQISGTLPEISDDVVLELPFSMVEPQLKCGRVAIDPKLFRQAIPEAFREVFVIDPTETPVLLPLQEVLQHLPSTALKMRHDQEKDEAVNYFETPFSQHAAEDHKRFKSNEQGATGKEQGAGGGEKAKTETPATPTTSEAKAPEIKPETTKPEAVPAEKTEPSSQKPAEPENTATVSPPPTAAAEKPAAADGRPKAPSVEVTSSAKEFMVRVSCLPGVDACSIAFADGLSMAGNFPPGLGADGICAMAPSLLLKIEKHMPQSDLGELTAMTLHCAKSLLTFFMQGNVCLTVLHHERQLEPVTQEQLREMTKELAQVFAQPETTHVDH